MSLGRWLIATFLALGTAGPVTADNLAGELVRFAIATAPPSPFRLAKLGPEARTYKGPEMAGRLVLPCHDPAVFHPWLKRFRG